jgi:hypothetical protein
MVYLFRKTGITIGPGCDFPRSKAAVTAELRLIPK